MNDFVTTIKSKDNELNQMKKQLNQINSTLKTTNDRITAHQQCYFEERSLRKYYQSILLKMTRDLKLYDEEEPDKKEKFESIFENEDDLNYQR